MQATSGQTEKPLWWHKYGQSVTILDELTPPSTEMTLTSGSCHVKISKGRNRSTWAVRWIIYAKGSDKVDGFRTFNTSELRLAFGLVTFGNGGSDPVFVRKNLVTAGVPGKYIRLGQHLNIPCKGTGEDGDPNASIIVSDAVSKAVARFIERAGSSDQ
jgi:hypothetical protein